MTCRRFPCCIESILLITVSCLSWTSCLDLDAERFSESFGTTDRRKIDKNSSASFFGFILHGYLEIAIQSDLHRKCLCGCLVPFIRFVDGFVLSPHKVKPRTLSAYFCVPFRRSWARCTVSSKNGAQGKSEISQESARTQDHQLDVFTYRDHVVELLAVRGVEERRGPELQTDVRSPRARELLQGVHVRVSGSTRARNGDSSFYEAMHKPLKLLSASQVSESVENRGGKSSRSRIFHVLIGSSCFLISQGIFSLH